MLLWVYQPILIDFISKSDAKVRAAYDTEGLPCAHARLAALEQELAKSQNFYALTSLLVAIAVSAKLVKLLYKQGVEALSMLWLSLHHPDFVPRLPCRLGFRSTLSAFHTSAV